MTTNETPFLLPFDQLTLWRDGGQAVVSLSMGGRWVRVLTANIGDGVFHETVRADDLRGLSWDEVVEQRRRRHNLQRPKATP